MVEDEGAVVGATTGVGGITAVGNVGFEGFEGFEGTDFVGSTGTGTDVETEVGTGVGVKLSICVGLKEGTGEEFICVAAGVGVISGMGLAVSTEVTVVTGMTPDVVPPPPPQPTSKIRKITMILP